MAKYGIKIKQLALELGVTSRALVDRCRKEGLWVQNSITKLTVEQADRVRAWFDNVDAPACDREVDSDEGRDLMG